MELSAGPLLMGLLGGLALFLFGMEQMSTALKAVAGDRLKDILARLTTHRITAVLTGAFVTAVLQSSSITTVLLVGFISAGLMSLSQAIGVIMGANIGTTITAQIIAFKITSYALLMVAIGFALLFLGTKERIRQQGGVVMGLGLVFFGMGVMGDAMSPLRDYAPFLRAMARMENPLLGILAGTVFTAIIQSSSATAGIVIVMASQGLLTLSGGIALCLGANIGTCITAILAAIGKPRESLRAAMVHVVFNVAGVLLWVSFVDELAWLAMRVSPHSTSLTGAARIAADMPRQIANAHTIFNVANTFVFLPFAPQFARLVERLVPDRPIEEEEQVRAKYLDEELLSTPALALDRARLEIVRLGARVEEMAEAILPAILTGSNATLTAVAKMDDMVDALHGQIVTYLGKISQVPLTEAQTEDFLKLMETTNDLESIGDIIETNLVTIGRERISQGVTISRPTKDVIAEFHSAVSSALADAMLAATERSKEAAQRVVDMKREINRLASSAALHEARRLVAKEPNRLPAYAVEMDILENLKRIYYFCKRIAREVIPPESMKTAV
jgi:phosphate:Na+ symporter